MSFIALLLFCYALYKPEGSAEDVAETEIVMDEIAPIPSEYWFNDIYLQLIKRI